MTVSPGDQKEQIQNKKNTILSQKGFEVSWQYRSVGFESSKIHRAHTLYQALLCELWLKDKSEKTLVAKGDIQGLTTGTHDNGI